MQHDTQGTSNRHFDYCAQMHALVAASARLMTHVSKKATAYTPVYSSVPGLLMVRVHVRCKGLRRTTAGDLLPATTSHDMRCPSATKGLLLPAQHGLPAAGFPQPSIVELSARVHVLHDRLLHATSVSVFVFVCVTCCVEA